MDPVVLDTIKLVIAMDAFGEGLRVDLGGRSMIHSFKKLVGEAIAAEVAGLPPHVHRDPADRIIIATARVLGCTLLTLDKRIIDSNAVATLA